MEKISSELKMDCIDVQTNVNGVMITDMLPTEWHNNFFNGIVSSPKDECQETSEEFGGMVNITFDKKKLSMIDLCIVSIFSKYYLYPNLKCSLFSTLLYDTI